MEKPEESWIKDWCLAIEGQVGTLKEDPWKFKVEASKKELQDAFDDMKKNRLHESKKAGSSGVSESEIELNCLKNFEEAIRYIKNLLADFARQ